MGILKNNLLSGKLDNWVFYEVDGVVRVRTTPGPGNKSKKTPGNILFGNVSTYLSRALKWIKRDFLYPFSTISYNTGRGWVIKLSGFFKYEPACVKKQAAEYSFKTPHTFIF